MRMISIVTALILAGVLLIDPGSVLAQGADALSGLEVTGGAAGFDTSRTSVAEVVAGLVQAAISLVGIVFVLLLLYGGVLYMTASGDETRVQKAKRLLTSSVIGLVITVFSYAIAVYVINVLVFSQAGTSAQQQAEVDALKAEICAQNPNDPICLGE